MTRPSHGDRAVDLGIMLVRAQAACAGNWGYRVSWPLNERQEGHMGEPLVQAVWPQCWQFAPDRGSCFQTETTAAHWFGAQGSFPFRTTHTMTIFALPIFFFAFNLSC
jgi:hypothetical protein